MGQSCVLVKRARVEIRTLLRGVVKPTVAISNIVCSVRYLEQLSVRSSTQCHLHND